jgi:hypothetical protein
MSVYLMLGVALVCLPIALGLVGFLSRWSRLGPQPVEPHGPVWGRRCPRCQSDDFAPLGDGRQRCARCGHAFI